MHLKQTVLTVSTRSAYAVKTAFTRSRPKALSSKLALSEKSGRRELDRLAVFLNVFLIANFLALSLITPSTAGPGLSTSVSPKQTEVRETSADRPKHKKSVSGQPVEQRTELAEETISKEHTETSSDSLQETGARSDTSSSEASVEAQSPQSAEDEPGKDIKDIEATTAGEDAQANRLQANESLDHYELSKFYTSQWDYEMAEVELEAAIMYLPTLKIAHRDYAIVSLLRGHPLRALAELMMVVGLGDPIPFTNEEKAELKVKAAKLHYRKALAYGKKEQWANAVSELKWALGFSPKNAAIQRSLAFAYASSGDLDAAEKEYMNSFNTDPTDGFAHADFAFVLSDNGKDEHAMSELTEAVKLEPKAAALHVDLGWLAERRGDFETAKNEINKAIEFSPHHAVLWAHLGRLLERQGKSIEAQSAYMKALAIDPLQDNVKKRLDHLN